eukprot:3813125-Alexandrium_andersonii.AAC.1
MEAEPPGAHHGELSGAVWRKPRSKDVHWPLTLAMRNKLTPSAERHRSTAGLACRKAYKASRGHGYAPGARPGTPG